MKKKYEHTVAILAYKESPYLEKCIRSLKKQTVESRIFIATSTPSVFLDRISGQYNIPLIINNSKDGIASDWSFAYNKCRTRYLTLAHQDDLYFPEYTESCLAAAKKRDNDVLITFTGYSEMFWDKVVDLNMSLLVKKMLLSVFLFRRSIVSSFAKKSILCFGNPIPCSSVMYNRELIGSFEFSKEFCCNMDWDAWLRLSDRKGSFVCVKNILMIHRIHREAQTSMQIKNGVRKKEDKKIFERLWPKPIAGILADVYYFGANSGRME